MRLRSGCRDRGGKWAASRMPKLGKAARSKCRITAHVLYASRTPSWYTHGTSQLSCLLICLKKNFKMFLMPVLYLCTLPFRQPTQVKIRPPKSHMPNSMPAPLPSTRITDPHTYLPCPAAPAPLQATGGKTSSGPAVTHQGLWAASQRRTSSQWSAAGPPLHPAPPAQPGRPVTKQRVSHRN